MVGTKTPSDSHSVVIKKVKANPETPHYVVNFLETSQSYCVGLVDIVNSTQISASLTQHKLSKYYEVFLNSMAQIIEKFGGFVIKNIGDSLLFYFPDSSKSSKGYDFKNCLECGLTMIEEHENINKILKKEKLPSLNYRISADYGGVSIMKINVLGRGTSGGSGKAESLDYDRDFPQSPRANLSYNCPHETKRRAAESGTTPAPKSRRGDRLANEKGTVRSTRHWDSSSR